MNTAEILQILKNTSLFASFNEEQLEVVPKIAPPKKYPAGTVIVSRGDENPRSMWLILDGSVEVRVGPEAVNTLGRGAHFGEMALLAGSPRSADVVALDEVMALELRRSHLEGLIASDPAVGVQMLEELARRLEASNNKLDSLTSESSVQGRHQA